MNRRLNIVLVLTALLALTMATGCGDDVQVEPSFLHVDNIRLTVPSVGAVSTDTGFYTSKIVAAYVILKRPGSMEEEEIGLFELPFTAPILFNGEAEYIELAPAVPQSGKMLAVPYYTFYKRIRIEAPQLATGDTLDLGTCTTSYDITLNDLQLFEPFEPTQGNLKFDSVMQWVRHAPDEARSGEGYGYVHIDDTVVSQWFQITDTFYVTDPTKLVYLELDARSDVPFGVYMYASKLTGGNPQENAVMTVYADTVWQHLYINLGRTWTDVNHNPKFQLHFVAFNEDGKGGDVRLDNVKLVTTSKSI